MTVVVAASVLGFGLAVLPTSPAQASVSDCPREDSRTAALANICLWDWVAYNTSGGYWRRQAVQVKASANGCMNLGGHNWENKSTPNVGDHASSLVVNSNPGIYAAQGYRLEFYEWVNCNEGGRSFEMRFLNTPDIYYIPYLSNILNYRGLYDEYEGTNFNDTIMSVKFKLGGI